MKKIMKCGTALLLALIMCLSMLPVNAFAASKQIYIWNFPLSDDTKKDSGSWGHGTLKMRFGYNLTPNPYTQARCVDSWQGEVAYCVEPAAPQGNYDTVSSYSDSWWDHMTLPSGHPLTRLKLCKDSCTHKSASADSTRDAAPDWPCYELRLSWHNRQRLVGRCRQYRQ